jgi:beta-lactam-binding protein with PASTA domain
MRHLAVRIGVLLTIGLLPPADAVAARALPSVVRVPALVGRTQSDAESMLQSVGLTAGQVNVIASKRIAGTVIRQSPPADSLVVRGSPVSIDVSEGPNKVAPISKPTLVPDVRGLPIEEAKARVGKAGLVADSIRRQVSEKEPGTIIDENPPAGTRVPRGTTVMLTAALAAPMIEVPDVVHHPVDEARTMIAAVGLENRVVWSPSESEPGLVIDEQPQEGTPVKPLSIVVLTVATPRMVRVPRLTGKTMAQAREALENNGLLVGILKPSPPDTLNGVITVQKPLAGTRVNRGWIVDLTFGHAKTRPLVRAELRLSDTTVTVGDSVSFEMRVDPPRPSASFRFDFGDGGTFEGLDQSRVRHAYLRAGDYVVRATVLLKDGSVLRGQGPVHVRPNPWPIAAAVIVIGGAAGLAAHQLLTRPPSVGFKPRVGDPVQISSNVGQRPAWSLALITPGSLQASVLRPDPLRATVVRRSS